MKSLILLVLYRAIMNGILKFSFVFGIILIGNARYGSSEVSVYPFYYSLDVDPVTLNLSLNYSEEVRFILYSRECEGPQELNYESSFSSCLDPSLMTYFIVHGYLSDGDSSINKDITENLLRVKRANVIVTDWSFLSIGIDYIYIASEIPCVAHALQRFIQFLIYNNRFSPRHIHLIGHSLGAHICGFAGKGLQRDHGIILRRITGLDPAGVGFSKNEPSERLDKNDASFVDCIHTCGGIFGIGKDICGANFFVNDGIMPQKGCPLIAGICSHSRAYQYFAESIFKDHRFIAATCRDFKRGKPTGCFNEGAIMGYPANNRYRGSFFLQTNGKYPFATNQPPQISTLEGRSR